ncbi:type 1 glutamine amidotransferase domain-containing protein [Paraburkholderia silvatlantica]|uniref:Protease I n=1 Tax=Paraburkholderia silvatlantica TaxID=321895 RepID=A0ABR6FYT4_9BURK|nr:type 1 glutamine amidotransferase domain-containing protein [Paraburkholderia silvatlantica]MBB2931935.1 protease I [Paraburkholderia silvatlantica]PVY24613.1 protease I [Paraburkholderia silvatlantica]PXW31109.1 protease I [Paraburkholderia silvatlantica]
MTRKTRVLIMSTDGFEDSELYSPRQSLLDAGVRVTLASPGAAPIRGTVYNFETGHSPDSSETITPDMLIANVDVADYDALLLPGGVVNPDKLRLDGHAIEVIRAFNTAGKPVAAICHGPWLLVEADVLRGRKVTGWYSIRTDLKNAGATVEDKEVVVDGNLITSRMPTDIPAFTEAFVAALSA